MCFMVDITTHFFAGINAEGYIKNRKNWCRNANWNQHKVDLGSRLKKYIAKNYCRNCS